MRQGLRPFILVFVSLGLGACATNEPYDFHRAPASSQKFPELEVDGSHVETEKTRAMIWGNPVETFRSKSVKFDGRALEPHRLKKGEHVYVHSNRYFWSPRQSGQAFFDTFLFGCESLPPSPLDRVVTEGLRMKSGETALIEEYPDRAATVGTQPIAYIVCAD